VVSLSPAVSQVIVDLGMGEKIVGRNQIDPALPDSVPMVAAGYNDIKLEPLSAASPTHILVQGMRFPPGLADFAEKSGILLVRYPDPRSIEDIYKMISTRYYGEGPDGGGCIGGLLDRLPEAEALSVRVLRKLRAIEEVITESGKPRQRVLLSYGGTVKLDACGPRTVHDQLLRDFLNCTNVLEDASTDAVSVSTETLTNLDPDVIVLMRPGEPAMRSIATDPRLQVVRDLPIKAVENGRVGIVTHELVLLPSSSIWIAASEIGKVIYPDLADAIDARLAQIDARPTPAIPTARPSASGSNDE
jgi:ABC-type Fe3+-hydroxamate transport system substrate-binding protein